MNPAVQVPQNLANVTPAFALAGMVLTCLLGILFGLFFRRSPPKHEPVDDRTQLKRSAAKLAMQRQPYQ